MPTDDPLDQPVVHQVVQPLVMAVALPRGIHQRQAARRGLGQEALLQRHGNLFGKTDADEARGGDRVAIADQVHRIGGADDLAVVVRLR